MSKLSGAAKAAVVDSTRAERLARFADGLEQLAGRWEREARDPRVAAALSERFGASAPELLATQDAVAHLLASSFGTPGALPPKLLLRLHDALAALALLAAYTPVATDANIVPIVDVKSRAQAVRLETATRKLLKGLGRVLAAGAVGATVLSALPVAAADYVSTSANGGNGGGGSWGAVGGSGDSGDPGGSTSPSINGTFTSSTGEAVLVTANGGAGGTGGYGNIGLYGEGGNGGVGGAGGSVYLTVDGLVATTGVGHAGVKVQANAGRGGNGGDGDGAYGEGGNGARGGAGGTASIVNNAQVTTQDSDSAGLMAQSVGGAGGDGGDGAGIVGAGGTGSGSGPGGEVSVGNAGHVETFGDRSHGILAQSVGGLAGAGGSAGGIGAFAGGSNAAGAGDRVELLGYLTGELACGREHERGGRRRRRGGALRDRDPEGERLTGAGLRAREHVGAGERVAHDERLDLERRGDASCGERPCDGLGHAELRERRMVHVLLLARGCPRPGTGEVLPDPGTFARRERGSETSRDGLAVRAPTVPGTGDRATGAGMLNG